MATIVPTTPARHSTPTASGDCQPQSQLTPTRPRPASPATSQQIASRADKELAERYAAVSQAIRQQQTQRPETVFRNPELGRILVRRAGADDKTVVVLKPPQAGPIEIDPQLLQVGFQGRAADPRGMAVHGLAGLEGQRDLGAGGHQDDLGVVAETCQRVGVMYAGNLCEVADVEALFSNPRHPYTQALLAAVPKFSQEGQLKSIDGNVPNLVTPPPGCRFHPRCAQAKPACRERFPADTHLGNNHTVACYLYTDQPRASAI